MSVQYRVDSICLVQMSVQYIDYMFSSNDMYNIVDTICLVQMSVQYTWQCICSSNECTIYLRMYILFKWEYNILDSICLVQMSVQYDSICLVQMSVLDSICLVQMSVQYTWQYMFSSNECTIYLTVYV